MYNNNKEHDNYKDLPTITLAVGLNSCVVLHPVRGSIRVAIAHTIPNLKYFLKYEISVGVAVDKEGKLKPLFNDIRIPKKR
ncbi:hypothetical protein [Psychrobacter sp. 16-MNA-CIBAN-0192]|uniref:hypothetical protein n=1 Tax=Psychrobacter sp. 16-MNA-CIBAN-0192 TaxID=3140448 RepID=UPI00332FEFA8